MRLRAGQTRYKLPKDLDSTAETRLVVHTGKISTRIQWVHIDDLLVLGKKLPGQIVGGAQLPGVYAIEPYRRLLHVFPPPAKAWRATFGYSARRVI